VAISFSAFKFFMIFLYPMFEGPEKLLMD